MGLIEWLKLQLLKILGRSKPAILGVIALAWIGFLIETVKILSATEVALLIPFVAAVGSITLMAIVIAIIRVS